MATNKLGYSRAYALRRSLTPQWRFSLLKSNAKRRNISLEMTINEFIYWFGKQRLNCYYCGISLITHGNHSIACLTIDRRDNKLGYKVANIVLTCQRCNMMKGSWLTEKEMVEIAEKYLTPKEM